MIIIKSVLSPDKILKINLDQLVAGKHTEVQSLRGCASVSVSTASPSHRAEILKGVFGNMKIGTRWKFLIEKLFPSLET